MGDGFDVALVEVHPDLNAVAVALWLLGGDEAEAVDLFAAFECGADELEGKALVDVLFIGLGFGHLENEPSSFLILLILPLGLDACAEELDGVDFVEGAGVDLVAGWGVFYAFCRKSSLRKK